MMTSCPASIADRPFSIPRQDMTTALSLSPPSIISSHPSSLLPWDSTIFSSFPVNQLCSPGSSVMPFSAIRALHLGQSFHDWREASSPPIWMNSEGNISTSSLMTSSMKPNNAGLAGHMSELITGFPSASMQANSGQAVTTSLLCPGISNSGITSI